MSRRKLVATNNLRPRNFAQRENNDCGVLALSAVACVDYAVAHAALAAAGRRNGNGTWLAQMYKAAKALGIEIGEFKSIRPTKAGAWHATGANVLDHVPPRGHYIIGSTNHWFAVVDGVVYDNGGLAPRARLDGYYVINF